MSEQTPQVNKPSGLPSRREIHGSKPAVEAVPAADVKASAASEPTRVSLFNQVKPTEAAPEITPWEDLVSPAQSQKPKATRTGGKATAGKGTTGGRAAKGGATGGRAAKGGSQAAAKSAAKAPAKAKPGFFKRLLKGTFLLGLVGFIIGAISFMVAYTMIKVPAPGEFALAQNTTVYYSDGESELGSFGELNRTIIDPKTLPAHVGHAVVASEDRTFYTNSGIDLMGIGRAAFNNLKGGPLQGGSTLSQQYVERYYLDTTTGYWGKLKEAILALKINRQQSKEEILGNYLNTIYFGRGAYGIEEAAQRYFGHPASELTISESAMLAGIIPAPSAWDPAISPEKAQQRFERVLDLMVEDKWITAEERSAAQFPSVKELGATASFTGTNGYLMEQIRQELIAKAGFTPEQINTGGYKIISTLDKGQQEQAVRAVSEIPEGHAPNLRVALSAVDPRTGEIVAEYAGADYQQLQSNSVTQDYAMAGSTMKPLGLMGYIAAGGSINDVYNANSGVQIVDSRTGEISPPIRNYDDISYGMINLRYSTAKSANTSFLAMNDAMGPEKTTEAAKRLGLPDNSVGLEDNLNNILGSAAVHNIDLTRAYATFASGGVRIDPHIVRSVSDSSGETVYTASTKGERVYTVEEVSEILPALKDVISQGSGYKAAVLGRPVAGKTGTSQDAKSAQFVAFIPQLVTTVTFHQVGPNGEQETITPWNGLREVTGSSIPGEVWVNFMSSVLDRYEYADFDWFVPQNRVSKFTKHAYVPPTPKPEKEVEQKPEEKPAPAEKPVEQPQPQPPAEEKPAEPAQPGQLNPEPSVPAPKDPNDKPA